MAIRCINYCVFFMFMADASIIPFQLSAHLSSTVYGIAEKVFTIQAKQFGEQDGTCLKNSLWFEALLIHL